MRSWTTKLNGQPTSVVVGNLLGEKLRYLKTGKPIIQGSNISISHKDNLLYVATSDRKIGVDIENRTSSIASLAQDKIFTAYLRSTYFVSDSEAAVICFSLRESFAKCFDVALVLDAIDFVCVNGSWYMQGLGFQTSDFEVFVDSTKIKTAVVDNQ